MSSQRDLLRFDRFVDSVPEWLLPPARAIAFWTAIAMPFGYLPIFAFEWIDVTLETSLALLAINVVALVLGHDHRR